ncbi:MAG: cation diffusion facilitator family transporter [Acidiferrobacterales bacterium]|nr:cation diffusion facilitator family transporter [Acidiferrobacterales bacterium]
MGAYHHHHLDPKSGDKRVFSAVFINLLLTIAQIIGGIVSGSLALIADAIHNLSDAIALVIAFAARKITRRSVDSEMTFGYGRAEVVAALVNYTTLIVIGFYLVYESVFRLLDPQDIDGWIVVVIAGIALVIDLTTALLTFSMSKSSVNIRAAFLHNLADALGSVGVIIAGTLIILYDWRLIDPIITLVIAGYILWQAFSEIGDVVRILMLGAPKDLETYEVVNQIKKQEGVANVHHVHFWQMQEHQTALEAHIVVSKGHWEQADKIKTTIKQELKTVFNIEHFTLELECFKHQCDKPLVIGH